MNKALKSNQPKNWNAQKKKKKIARVNAHDVFSNLKKTQSVRALIASQTS